MELVLDFSILKKGQLTSLATGKVVGDIPTCLRLQTATSWDGAAPFLSYASPARKQGQLSQGKCWPTCGG